VEQRLDPCDGENRDETCTACWGPRHVPSSLRVGARPKPDLVVVAQAGSLAEGRVAAGGADAALVHLGLPDGDGTRLVRELREADRPSRCWC
jgi:DNA-binding NarL/FixJ family response regulator